MPTQGFAQAGFTHAGLAAQQPAAALALAGLPPTAQHLAQLTGAADAAGVPGIRAGGHFDGLQGVGQEFEAAHRGRRRRHTHPAGRFEFGQATQQLAIRFTGPDFAGAGVAFHLQGNIEGIAWRDFAVSGHHHAGVQANAHFQFGAGTAQGSIALALARQQRQLHGHAGGQPGITFGAAWVTKHHTELVAQRADQCATAHQRGFLEGLTQGALQTFTLFETIAVQAITGIRLTDRNAATQDRDLTLFFTTGLADGGGQLGGALCGRLRQRYAHQIVQADARQLQQHVARRGMPLDALLAQGLAQQSSHRVQTNRLGQNGFLRHQLLIKNIRRRHAFKYRTASQALDEHQCPGVQIGLHTGVFAAQLFRRAVGGRAQAFVCQGHVLEVRLTQVGHHGADTKIQHLGMVDHPITGNHDVFWLEVAVNNAQLVGASQRIQHLAHQPAGFQRVQRAFL